MTETAEREDLAVMFPDVDVTVRDPETRAVVKLTVREPRFRDALLIAAEMRSLIAALAAISPDEPGEAPDATAIDEVLGRHADEWLDLMARATGRESGWLAGLADEDGHALSLAMWETHGPLFVRRVAMVRAAARRSPGEGSSTSSSGPGTQEGTASSRTG